MKIVIPMSGEGSRFIRAGFTDPKPLIKVHNKTFVEFVVNLFPNEKDILFVCRKEHLDTTNMGEILKELCPSAEILSIVGSKKGPVWAVDAVSEHLDDNEPTIVNYCDFFMNWDYPDFKAKVAANNCDGAIPCYLGFHPHLLHEKNFYASCKVDENNNLIEIREKYSFNPDKTQSPQSVGTYYFGSGAIVKHYFKQAIKENIELNGEFYVSLVYNLMVRDGLKVWIYDKIPHFCQWGTPEDFSEYKYWSGIFEKLA